MPEFLGAQIRYVVSAIRYKDESQSRERINQAIDSILSTLKNESEKTILWQILNSMAYRGIAMAVWRGETFMWESLKKSEEIAVDLFSASKYEQVILKENLITLYQTFYRTHLIHKQEREALEYLKKMKDIDPYDSTLQLEEGLFYGDKGDYASALPHFIKAFELGPPGLGMSGYFAGVCCKNLNRLEDAEKWFLTSIENDELSISSFLELVEFYEKTAQMSKQSQIVNQILTTESLKEQLEPHEIEALRKNSS
ncbi:MAG: hypothetical protein R2827_00975 [Bdellovibrionales bacterium]